VIRRVYSDLQGFKDLEFRPGLNVLLADKSAGASKKQTRNGAGKSSLLEVIHFLLGANNPPDSIFRTEALTNAIFGMEFDLADGFTRVERSGAPRERLTVAGDFSTWPTNPTKNQGVSTLSNEHWKTALGHLMFGLGEFSGAWAPSFRSLIKYFARQDRDGAMTEPMKSSAKQRLVDQQVGVSFLIGLDWSVPREWQAVRDQEKSLEELKKAMKKGAFGSIVTTASKLKSELIVADGRARRLAAAVASFKVLEQYHRLEQEASVLTRRLAEIADENLLDRRYVAELEASTAEDVPPAPSDLEALFREAGAILPDLVRRRFDEASAFHDSIVKNRRLYLDSELTMAHQRIKAREHEKRRLDERRSELMTMLQSAGALEHFTALQSELTKAEAAAEVLRQRHQAAEALESGQVKLEVERATLSERLRREYAEHDEVIQAAVLTFHDISAQLYEQGQAGDLTITPTKNGPIFDPHIPAEKSKGVNNMRIFCFDMMLMLLSLRRGRSPGFLIHDSHLFDGVDERQVGSALAVGAALARQHGFQYIVTMNTDAVPRETPSGFKVEDYALDVRLTDATADGGLFGLRFE